MSIQTFGEEGMTHVGGQEFIDMEPRVWYEVPACTIIENQFGRPLLLSYEQPPLLPAPNTVYDPASEFSCVKESLQDIPGLAWPSPHFRETITAFTIKAGETVKTGDVAYILSTNKRFQPIDTSGAILTELANGGSVGTGTGTEMVDPIQKELKILCRHDNVNGDLSMLVNYYEACQIVIDDTGLTSNSLGTFTDECLTTPYVPVAPIDINDVGDPVVAKQRMVNPAGFDWSPGPLIKSYTIRVIGIGDIANPPSFCDSDGIETDLEVGEVFTYAHEADVFDTTPILKSTATDNIKITYLELAPQ